MIGLDRATCQVPGSRVRRSRLSKLSHLVQRDWNDIFCDWFAEDSSGYTRILLEVRGHFAPTGSEKASGVIDLQLHLLVKPSVEAWSFSGS